MIRLIELTKRFNRIVAVDHLNLEVKAGSVIGFLGPNGAGKTTTIKMMAGVLKPTKGRIVMNGIDLQKEPSKAKANMGYIPDRPFIYEKLTGQEFLEFIANLYSMEKKEARYRIDHLLNLFDLEEFRHELIESYSHGMKQRLVMCSAIIHDPDILIIDEPMVGLDPKGARLVKDMFRNFAKQGKTVFISTHSLDVAEDLTDEIVIIDRGTIIARGTMDGLRKRAGIEGDLEEIFLRLTGNEISTTA